MENLNNLSKKYLFIGKTLFFPKDKILALGDLHLGYGASLRNKGLELNLNQFEETKKEIEKTITHITAKYGKIQKIVLLGDIKYRFGYIGEEKKEINELLKFLKNYLPENEIIFLRGNHEKNYKNEKFLDYYIHKDIIFIHGDREFLEIYDKTINYVIMGHLHPSIVLKDEMAIKSEKYKCFLKGKHKKKEFIVLPSFLGMTEGLALNEFNDEKAKGYDFSLIPQKELKNFEVFIVPELGDEALSFGKVKSIN